MGDLCRGACGRCWQTPAVDQNTKWALRIALDSATFGSVRDPRVTSGGPWVLGLSP